MCGKGKAVPRSDDPSGALDVYINDRVYWANVPADVWAMTIGGYPVLKKWLTGPPNTSQATATMAASRLAGRA